MKFLTFAYRGRQYPAVLSGDGSRAVPLEALGFTAPTLEEFITSGATNRTTDQFINDGWNPLAAFGYEKI